MSPDPISSKTQLPVFDTMKAAWEKVEGVKAFFCATSVCLMFLYILSHLVSTHLQGFFLFAVVIVLFLLESILRWDLIYMGIKRTMGVPIQYDMIKYAFDVEIIIKMVGLLILMFLLFFVLTFAFGFVGGFLSAFVAQALGAPNVGKLLTALVYIVGLVIFVFLVMRISLASALVLDKRINPWNALTVSFEMTKSNVLPLFAIFTMNLIILVISAIPFGIGLIWTIPYVSIAYGEVYKKLVLLRDTPINTAFA